MNLFLIAHKVRGEPAFDIAEQMQCPECHQHECHGCAECDFRGFWWIISTSGHRAYPYHDWKLDDVLVECAGDYESITYGLDEMPPSLPDHYPTRSSPKSDPSSGKSLLAALGLIPKVVRRL